MTSQKQTVEAIESLARLMDSQFNIPGIPSPLGLDTIIGFIPGIGDTVGLSVSAYIILQGARLGLPKLQLIKMTANVGIDWLIGLIPLIGDIFDWGWKANNRNAAIIRDFYKSNLRPKPLENVTPPRTPLGSGPLA
ncbi:DUF4112 domain-containing protein [Hellea balneolensis]|uniref:DUF4112 domain-containing protein n=1 Tax=Hellea balneolensis TaxID=287478 RepID=UPI000553F9BF|nr:DUF4112 domain-containing protein [Hellea balneolensis]